MRTVVRRVLLLSALMSPGVLQALGLGDIRLNSALNQPFDAEIELISATQDDLGALRATLASGDTFTRYGLDRPSFLSDFSFRVAKGTDGRDVLRVTSPRPVTEPFVTLLVEANWPRGRLLREYTVLLDPPVYAPAQTAAPEAAVAAPRVSSGGATSVRTQETVAQETVGQETVSQESAPSDAPTVASQPRRATAAASSIEPGSTYTVRPNDTLFRIASAAHPGTRADVNRAMVAIYQGNPSAFQNNINVLRSGSTLRIPQSSEVSAVSTAAASAEVARQYESWRGGQLDGTTAPTPTDTGRLRLVTPEQGTPAPSTATAVPPAAASTSASPATNVDARVKQLEAELAEARRLLEVRNAELATLQGGAAPVTPQTGAAGAETTPAVGEPAATDSTPAAEPAAVPAPTPVAQEAKPKKPAKPPRVEPEAPSLLERAMEYWWLLLALVAALAGAWLFQRLRRERGSAEADLEDALGRDMRSAASRTPPAPRPRDGGIVVEEKRANDGHRLAPATVAVAAAPAVRATEPVRKPATVEDTLSGDGPASLESGDPLAEADFHMAYGLYDQAADLVQLAMKREPNRRDLKLKLLEIFFVWGNKDRFLQLAGEMNATRAEAPAGEWDKIMIMGKQIAPKDTMFTGAARSSDEALDLELNDATRELDIDLMAGEASGPDLDVGETEISRADSSGIDFILDEPVRGADDDSSVGPTVETPQVRRGEGDTAELPVDSLGRTQVVRRGEGDTAELPVESLGLDVDAVRAIDALDDPDTIITKGNPLRSPVDTGSGMVTIDEDEELDVDLDMLGSTALMKLSEDTAEMLRGAGQTEEEGVIDLSESTGALPMLDSVELTQNEMRPSNVDFDLGGEPATMSEVGTKLDLARAYMDMGDPEGARSILDEVLGEGSIVQRQEAERLIAALP